MQSSPRSSILWRTRAQRRSRSWSDSRGSSNLARMCLLSLFRAGVRRAVQSGVQNLEHGQIIGYAFFQIVVRLVVELGPGERDVVVAGGRVGHAEECQLQHELDIGCRQWL